MVHVLNFISTKAMKYDRMNKRFYLEHVYIGNNTPKSILNLMNEL